MRTVSNVTITLDSKNYERIINNIIKKALIETGVEILV